MSVLSEFLKNKLQEKQDNNSAYSMRSFARDLNIDPSSLSKVMNGKRIPDLELVQQILEKLNQSPEEIEKICSKIEQEKNIKSFKISTPRKEYKSTPEIVFKIISDPIHYTFLELIKLNSGEFDTQFFTKKLKVSDARIGEVLNNLQQAGLIKIEDDHISDLTAGFSSHEIGLEQTNMANKEYQKSLLELSKEAIDEVEMENRDHSAIVFATNQRKIYEAKGIIKKFRQSLCDFLEDVDEKDSVYALHVGLFPVTKK